jgi:hypothetical protein
VICLAFTGFDLSPVYFFRSTMLVMLLSYWYGCWFLPVLLSYLDFDVVKMGQPGPVEPYNRGKVLENTSLTKGDTECVDETLLDQSPSPTMQREGSVRLAI